MQDKLREYKRMLDENLIDEQEFKKLKSDILNSAKTDGNPINIDWNGQNNKYENATMSSKEGLNNGKVTLYTTLGFIFAVISVLLFPIFFGAGGVIFGYLLTRSEEHKTIGVIIIIVNIAAAITGMLFGIAVTDY